MRTTACILTLGVFALSGCESRSRGSGDSGHQVAAAGVVPSAALRGSAQDSSPMVVRRIWGGPQVDLMGGVSYDGRFLSFVDWDTGPGRP